MVLLAAAIVGFRTKERTAETNAAANASEAPPTDPLAELGVAPGGTPSDSSATRSDPSTP
ncbi:hypothetical protein [Rhizorhabdus dicambivorans]|uniref:hypothetical protein n=1 Tax=Rhizorhabdus dicambivorans TaxID=1850238 RepID=UPI001EDDC5A8|nr:hypothetical protein [Rhizorhabdus dicambivorans]